jgi:hypothetical protein
LVSDSINGTAYSAGMNIVIRAINDRGIKTSSGTDSLASRFCEDWTGKPFNTGLALPKLVSGSFLEGNWQINCIMDVPVTLFAEVVFYSNAERKWFGEDFLIEVQPNENYQGSVRPTILPNSADRSSFLSSISKLNASNLSVSVNFYARDNQQIYFMEIGVCAPNGQCTSFDRRWYTDGNNYNISCTRNGATYDCGFVSRGTPSAVVSLFVPGVGSPRGSWTIKVRALNASGTYGVENFIVNI